MFNTPPALSRPLHAAIASANAYLREIERQVLSGAIRPEVAKHAAFLQAIDEAKRTLDRISAHAVPPTESPHAER